MKRITVDVPNETYNIVVTVDKFTDMVSVPRFVDVEKEDHLIYDGNNWVDDTYTGKVRTC